MSDFEEKIDIYERNLIFEYRKLSERIDCIINKIKDRKKGSNDTEQKRS